jgi:hypothetical protein
MSFESRVFRVVRFDQKTALDEVSYLLRYLHEEKLYIEQVCDFVASLERFYRNSAQAFPDAKSDISADLPATSSFQVFRRIRWAHAERLLSISQRLAALSASDLAPLKASFNAMRRHLKTELRAVAAPVLSVLEALSASHGGYDRLFRQLQQFLAVPQQAGKAVRSLDERLGRIWASYAAFDVRWIEYCTEKEPVFTMVHASADRSNAQIARIIDAVAAIDGGPVGDLRTAFDFEEPEQDTQDRWEEEDAEDSPFRVVLSQSVSIGDATLKINTQFVVLEADGDRWKVRDRMDRVWIIPQICLAADVTAK